LRMAAITPSGTESPMNGMTISPGPPAIQKQMDEVTFSRCVIGDNRLSSAVHKILFQ
jgi:hypothetical protein